MSDFEIRNDNRNAVKKAMEKQILVALEKCGMIAEGYAKDLCPVQTGALRNSISHKAKGETCYVGTNMEYAAYVELGTGRYYSGGRRTRWTYVDDNGVGHTTSGQKAQPYIKPSVADHAQEYKDTIKKAMKS